MIIRCNKYTLLLICVLALNGCTAISAVDVVASTAVDVTVGAAKATGKAIGKAVDIVTPDDD